ncbi:tyrosine-type recombinase/integrase [Streptomyces sp. RKAG337]|uniref:tyrosine-type recombinase/integrase n=1 Tax=Streptomyces sp. RKAG337 TaxID=2893404 RepID=UPI002033D58B|nr:tyrosine-type recombinase/integrase [Streptomyces sp. RKAG337]MCM2425068.1 tyrosine-type recombinase/integrase [Streptomyces sp. RKAG337]
MSDLAWDADAGRLLTQQLTSGNPLFIVCHAPAAILATRIHGESPFKGFNITCFTDEEEEGVGLASRAARPTLIPRPAAAERTIWTVPQAIRFLDFYRNADLLMADLVEVLIGTGIRKGEALGLHWNDVHPSQGVLYIRYTLSAVDNNQLVLTTPKTRTSKTWVAVSPRVASALQRRAHDKPASSGDGFRGGLVFHQPDGLPLHPGYVLNHFHDLSRQADVPRTTIHDLRHLAATISITAGVPLTVVSKTLRHSMLSTTANIYSHLTAQAAYDAVDSIDHTLTASDRTTNRHRRTPGRDHNPTTLLKPTTA